LFRSRCKGNNKIPHSQPTKDSITFINASANEMLNAKKYLVNWKKCITFVVGKQKASPRVVHRYQETNIKNATTFTSDDIPRLTKTFLIMTNESSLSLINKTFSYNNILNLTF